MRALPKPLVLLASTIALAVTGGALGGCSSSGPSTRAHVTETPAVASAEPATAAPSAAPTSSSTAAPSASTPTSASASAPPSPSARPGEGDARTSGATPPAEPLPTRVKVVTIGMHVAGGPFDEPTKEPFKKAVEPHFPEIARCWAKHVATQSPPPREADVGVDLLIEASGGRPKVSNPRSTLGKGPELQDFVPCVVAIFESVEFARLVGRGRTGVSYSLRFTEPRSPRGASRDVDR